MSDQVNQFRDQIRSALLAAKIDLEGRFHWMGNTSNNILPKFRQQFSADHLRNHLLTILETRLYEDFYCNGGVARSPNIHTPRPNSGDTQLLKEFSNANKGSGSWESGWTVLNMTAGTAEIQKSGLVVRGCSPEVEFVGGDIPSTGTRTRVRLPKEFFKKAPGFYVAVGDKVPSMEDGGLIRLYWNVTSEAAGHLISLITKIFNSENLPFTLKVCNHPNQFSRCDSAILYMPRSRYQLARPHLHMICREISYGLKHLIPAFTKPISFGLGLAEDPIGGKSFGMHRCRLLAEAILAASEAGIELEAERLALVENFFLRSGVQLATPYLNIDSNDDYTPPKPQRVKIVDRLERTKARSTEPPSGQNLETANYIAQRLCNSAFWDAQMCTWIAPVHLKSEVVANGQSIHRALGSDVYSGTAGIALMLGEMYRITGRSLFRTTALGAIRHSLYNVNNIPDSNFMGLYTGWPGVALVSARLAFSLQCESLIEKSSALIARYLEIECQDSPADLLSGRAGAIVSLAIIGDMICDSRCEKLAQKLADEIVYSAESDNANRLSWPSLTIPTFKNLTGFSHGTAGIAYSLCEIYSLTRDKRYADTAKLALEYESQFFDLNMKNWPDFRRLSSLTRNKRSPWSYSTAWCHGAPGIALSRMRVYEEFEDVIYREEAIAALETTLSFTDTSLRAQTPNYSLCHGLAGNAEILRLGQVLQGSKPALSCVSEVARSASLVFQSDSGWINGSPGETPGLMLGAAGIAYFCACLIDSSVPSILMPRIKDMWASG